MSKERLDVLLVTRGLAATREKAKRMIMAGVVLVDGKPCPKAGTRIDETAEITVKDNPIPYVGRGGLKLEKALTSFGVAVSGKTAIDVGASTGGFTDCLLQHGAKKVYAVDVGYGQLDWKLRNDSRVVVMERTNIRSLTPMDLGELVDLAVIDVSFISITKFLSNLLSLLKPQSEIIALIKPQFEAGPDKVGKKGVIRDSNVHREVLMTLLSYFDEQKLSLSGLTYSPITGADGNIEFLGYWKKGTYRRKSHRLEEEIESVVKESHALLKGNPRTREKSLPSSSDGMDGATQTGGLK